MHFASYNSNYEQFEESTATVAKDYTKTTTTDGKTVIRFVDVHQLDAAATYGIRFSVKIPSTATVGDQTVTIDAKVAKDKTTENTETLLPADDITVTAGKITVTPDCEHDWGFVSATPATHDASYAETAKGEIKLKCKQCETEETKELSFTVGSSLLTPGIDAGAETKLAFSTRKDILELIGTVEDCFIVFKQTYASGSTNQTVRKLSEAKITTDSRNRTVYNFEVGVPTKQMTDAFNGMVYICVDGSWYNGYSTDTSIKNTAMSVITSSTNENLKKLCANLLTMGAMSQNYFNYNTDNLANADLVGDYANYVTLTKPTLVNNESNYNNNYVNGSGLVGFATPSLSMESAVMMNFRIVTSVYTGSEDLENLKVTFAYTGTSGNTITETVTNLTAVSNGYSFSFGVAARYMRTPIKVTVYNGDVAVSSEVTFAVESILANSMGNTATNNLKDLADAIINYSDTATAAFAQ